MSNTENALKLARTKLFSAIKSSEATKNTVAKLKKDWNFTIPGFKKYEFNASGTPRNKETGNILSVTQRSKKFQLRHDNGKVKEMSLQAIVDLLPKQKPMLKEGKIRSPKTDNKKAIILALHKEGLDKKAIVAKTGYKDTTVFEAINTYEITHLYNLGKTTKEIAEKLGKKEESVKSFINRNIKHIK